MDNLSISQGERKSADTIYDDWLPADIQTTQNIIEQTKLPYKPRFSYGERLAAIVEGTNNPGSIGQAYETLAALIAHELGEVSLLIENRGAFVKAVSSTTGYTPIYISYGEESSEYAQHLHSRLRGDAQHDYISMDVAKRYNGINKYENIKNAMSSCEVMIVIIGREWLSAPHSKKELDDENDVIRAELEAAFSYSKIRVLPVLVQDVSMPRQEELPIGLQDLANHTALRVNDENLRYDMSQVIKATEDLLNTLRVSEQLYAWQNSIGIEFVQILPIDE